MSLRHDQADEDEYLQICMESMCLFDGHAHHFSAWPTKAMRREGGTIVTSWDSARAV